MRRSSQLAGIFLLLASAGRAIQAQAPASPLPPFTAEDALDVSSLSVADLSPDGRWAVVTSATRRDGMTVDYRRDGDPTYIRPAKLRLAVLDTRTGEQRLVFPDRRNARALRWSPDGSRLAMLVQDGETWSPMVWSRVTGRLARVSVPAGRYVAENSDLRWAADGRMVYLALRTPARRAEARARFAELTGGPILVMSSKDPFLSWDALRRSANVRSVVGIDVATGRVTEAIPETMTGSWELSRDGTVVTYTEDITKKTDYDVIGGSESRLLVRPATGGAARTLFATTKGISLVWSPDGTRYAYGREGRVYVATVADTTSRLVAGAARDTGPNARAAATDTSKAAREARDRERFIPLQYSPANDALLLSNREGLWVLDLASGTRERVVATSDSSSTLPRVSFAAWSQDGRTLWFTFASRLRWERGVMRYDRDTKQLRELVKDGRTYSGLRVARSGDVVLLNVAEGNRPPDLYAADTALRTLRPLVRSNPQLAAKALGGTELIRYLDADGRSRYGVVLYPVGYVKGRAYPTVFIVYEDFFDDAFDASANILAANGYVVVKPSVGFDIGYPGEAWLKGVTAAANKLIELGVSDSSRLGVQGTSYGGYATNLLITQTGRFKAAINISGKVDLISFYTDSPRLGVRNVHAAEKSQDRIGATLWQQPQKYVEHSAVMFADRITTPLLLITGQQDFNVPADNTREMYYALRRLGKEVVWVNYINGGHGGGNATPAEFVDMQQRIVRWYDEKMRPTNVAQAGDAAPSR